MSRGVVLYIIWCAALVLWLGWAGYEGYSPFADGARAPGASGFYGPQHK